ncbi:MAG: WXG100 family type VII secretion target [Actinobacteria bacterium]|nr:WXG100 family type VII secretion target [Actinomycetota bacterium]
MSGSFQTEVPTMDVASNHVFEVNDQIQAQLRSLLERLDPLMSSWQGAAANSFHVLKERWHENATKLNDSLRGIGDGLVQSRDTYAATEDTNVQSFTGMSTNLE